MRPYGYRMIWLFRLPPRMTISHSTMNYRKVMTKLNENNVPLLYKLSLPWIISILVGNIMEMNSITKSTNLHVWCHIFPTLITLELFLDIWLFPEKILLRQPSIDFDFCNLSSSGDVQCRLQGTLVTLTQAGYWYFFTILWAFYLFK
jgi:hypothetical protein